MAVYPNSEKLDSIFSKEAKRPRLGISPPKVLSSIKSGKSSVFTLGNLLSSGADYGTRRIAPSERLLSPTRIYEEIESGYDTDGYIRQAIDKYAEKITSQVIKVSDCIYTPYPEIKRYIVTRLNLFSEATGYPLNLLLTDVLRSLIKDGVVYIVKAPLKSTQLNIPGFKLTSKRNYGIIGGVYILEAKKMKKIIEAETNNLVAWVYTETLTNGKTQATILSPDMVYRYMYCPRGPHQEGTSQLLPALDDIRGLRNIEESTLKLIYRHLNPLIHVTSPDLSDVPDGDQTVINDLANSIANMSHDGILVTGPGVEIDSVGAESQALRVESYLNFFKSRSLAGLSVSPIIMGEGQYTSNTSASALASQMSDRANFYSKVVSQFFTETLIRDLLEEAGYPLLDVTSGEYCIEFKFPEFDLDELRRMQNHYADLYHKNIATRSQIRDLLNWEPLSSNEEDDTSEANAAKVAKKYNIPVKGVASQPK